MQTGPQGPVSFELVNGGERFTVLGFYNQTTAGTWYDIPVYDSGSDTTTFYGEAWHLGLGTAMEEQGTTLVPDVETVQWTVEKAQLREAVVYLTILSITVNTGADNDEIVVRGRADDLASSGDRFFIQVPPQFVNDPDDGTGQDAYTAPDRGGSRYLYAGYRYEMRRPGGALGSPQPNAGWYYCWNRMYDPLIGRWTSPDPLSELSENINEYVSGSPLLMVNTSGLTAEKIPALPGKGIFKCCGLPTYSGTPQMLLMPLIVIGFPGAHTSAIYSDINIANKIWAQCCISVRLQAVRPLSKTDDSLLYANSFNKESMGNWATVLEIAERGKPYLHAAYVKEIYSSSDTYAGFALMRRFYSKMEYYTGKHFTAEAIVISNDHHPRTLAHEIGHVVLDSLHVDDHSNLMSAMQHSVNGVLTSTNLTEAQCLRARSSSYVR